MISDFQNFDEVNELVTLNNESKYPNLYEYQTIPENNNYFIFPIQESNIFAFPECEDISKIYQNLTEEIGLFNIYKEINYDLELQKEFSTSMFTFAPPIDQKEFYNDLIFLLQGIPSSTFSTSNKYPFTFKFNENSNTNNFRLIGTLPGMTNNILERFINFGTKMQLLQFLVKKYLFDVNYRTKANNISPFFENFFRSMNELFIKINEKLIFYKKLITKEDFTMLTLYNKIKSLSQIINVIYILFNLKDQKYLNEFNGNTMEEFFEYYNGNANINNFKKINLFLDMLLKVYFTFYNKDKIFYIIKHILLSSLHSYLYYIINLLFTGESTDDTGSHFILNSNNSRSNTDSNISLDTKKLPQFLMDYKRALLNNTILTKYIKKFDKNYYNMLTYNLNDFIEYINNIKIRDFSIDTLNNFKAFKEEIYKKKLQLMEEVNKQVIYLQELKENEINLRNIKKIREIKNYFIDFEKEENKRKKMIKEKKLKYYNELNEQILGKKRKIEEEIKKIKNEQIEQREKERKEKEYEKKFMQLMKLKYREIQEKTRDIQIYGSLVNKWIFQRNELNEKRRTCFEKLYGDNYENDLDENYPIIEISNIEDSNNIKKNYHKTYEEQIEFVKNEMENVEEQENEDRNKRALYNNSDNIKLIFNQIEKKENEENKAEQKIIEENKNKEINDKEEKIEENIIEEEKIEENKNEEKKDEENKGEENKNEENKNEEKKIEENKNAENKDEEKKEAENKDEEKKETEKKDEEKKDDENKAEENKNDENKDEEKKGAENKDEEMKTEKNIDKENINEEIKNDQNENKNENPIGENKDEENKKNENANTEVKNENQEDNNNTNIKNESRELEPKNNLQNEIEDKQNINENNEEKEDNKIIDINDIQLDLSNNENQQNNKSEEKEQEKEPIKKEEKEEEKMHIEYDNKNKYLQNINLFPEKEIPEDTEALYKLTTLINEEEDNNNDIGSNDIFLNKNNKNKQIPIQLIIKEFFHDIIIKQNAITNQTFVLMLKNKFGLMHHFDFFNSIILCNKGNLILQYIESIFDFKTLTLNTSDPEFLTNELRSLVKAEYENNVKSLYLNSLLESLKFIRLSDLNLNYAINNLELNFKLEYNAMPPVDVIFNNSNSDSYDKIFKKLLKFNIYDQIGVRIYQMLKNARNTNGKDKKNKKMKILDFDEDELDENSFNNETNINNILNLKLGELFNQSFKIFKGVLTYIYQQIIQKTWMEMEKKIESSNEVFQIIKYHYDALKSINNFFNNNTLIKYFENLCNDLAQLYLQIMVSDYYDKQTEKTDFLEEIISKLKEDNKTIINFRDAISDLSPFYPLRSYL